MRPRIRVFRSVEHPDRPTRLMRDGWFVRCTDGTNWAAGGPFWRWQTAMDCAAYIRRHYGD